MGYRHLISSRAIGLATFALLTFGLPSLSYADHGHGGGGGGGPHGHGGGGGPHPDHGGGGWDGHPHDHHGDWNGDYHGNNAYFINTGRYGYGGYPVQYESSGGYPVYYENYTEDYFDPSDYYPYESSLHIQVR